LGIDCALHGETGTIIGVEPGLTEEDGSRIYFLDFSLRNILLIVVVPVRNKIITQLK